MRNLGLLSATTYTLPVGYSNHVITANTVDLNEGVLFIASESIGEADVNIQVWTVDSQGQLKPWAGVISPAVKDAGVTGQIIALTIVPGTYTLCLIMRCGDIAILSLETDIHFNESRSLDVVGTITPGNVLAASFAPDSSLLAIVTSTANPTLILMDTSSFDVISSAAVNTSEYGEDTPVNVGWGSKSTQFHGSLGKSAAQANTSTEYGTTTPDDDDVPRISWRGDAQFFAVSAVQGKRRVLRVYNRLAMLQSTAEEVPGFEHVLAWRPSGGLIAGTQRFGKVPLPTATNGTKSEERRDVWALGKGRDGRHDIVFFERNGLRHGDFTLRERNASAFSGDGAESPGTVDDAEGISIGRRKVVRCWGYRVRELDWNADSSILSIWMERDSGDVVQLWMTGNYHWYLKLEMPISKDKDGRLTGVVWHAEDPLRLILSTHNTVIDARYIVYTAASPLGPPNDTGLVAVIDGADILLTPFRTQNVPPPMASHRLPLVSSVSSSPTLHPQAAPIHISFASKATSSVDLMSTLFVDGSVAVWEIKTNLEQRKGKRDAVTPRVVWCGDVGETSQQARQAYLVKRREGWLICVLRESGENVDVLCVVSLAIPEGGVAMGGSTWIMQMPGRGGRLVDELGGDSSIVWQDMDGSLWEVLSTDAPQSPKLVARFPQFCSHAARVPILNSPSHSLFIGLSSSKLYVTLPGTSQFVAPPDGLSDYRSPPGSTLTLSQTCTSHIITGSYLIWTATAPFHEAVFARLETLHQALEHIHLESHAEGVPTIVQDSYEQRRIERGARIVTAVPSSMSLVLQMPRGNLETVMPRPLVMEQVRTDVQAGDYRAAFLACRKHRVDLNVIVELNPTAFTESIPSFVQQLDDIDHINLFLSGLGRSSLLPETINALSDGIRTELEQRDVKKFVNSILTAHVVKSPPDYEAGLSLLLRLRGTDPDLIEDAVKYIIFLVDANRLFDTALGMYDFTLVLLVAQHSQKDPREYLPFLRSLRAVEGPYQQFKIDDHLKRYEKALRSLHRAGRERFDEAKLYVEKHRLYTDALSIWKGEQDEYDAMLDQYGDYLFERREFGAAALAFVQSSRPRKAMVAFEKALEWQELFDLVVREGISGDELLQIARRVADDLGSKHRHTEAARVLLDYVDDTDAAVASLINGGAWSEARRIVALRNRDDLVASLIHPGTLEARSSISDEVVEIRDLLDKQTSRLDELAVKKLSQPETFYGLEDANLANVDVMTDVSNPGTMFTRYTVAPTSSDRSRRTSRSKRRLDRKAGRKGTVEEEEYLLRSLTKLVVRLEGVQAESRALLPHLLTLSDKHAREACVLRKEVETLEQTIKTNVERIWTVREQASSVQDDKEYLVDVGSGQINASNEKLTNKVPKPVVLDVPWKVGWMDMMGT